MHIYRSSVHQKFLYLLVAWLIYAITFLMFLFKPGYLNVNCLLLSTGYDLVWFVSTVLQTTGPKCHFILDNFHHRPREKFGFVNAIWSNAFFFFFFLKKRNPTRVKSQIAYYVLMRLKERQLSILETLPWIFRTIWIIILWVNGIWLLKKRERCCLATSGWTLVPSSRSRSLAFHFVDLETHRWVGYREKKSWWLINYKHCCVKQY